MGRELAGRRRETAEMMAPAPDARSGRAELIHACDTLRAELSPTDRIIARLCWEEGRSQAAVGEHLGLSRDQVYRRLVSIRERGRAWFEARGWSAPA